MTTALRKVVTLKDHILNAGTSQHLCTFLENYIFESHFLLICKQGFAGETATAVDKGDQVELKYGQVLLILSLPVKLMDQK